MDDASLRKHLVQVLAGRGAHIGVLEALRNLPPSLRNSRAPGITNTPWRLLEHLRIAQWDILEFSRNPNHVSPEFPAGYWPAEEQTADQYVLHAS